MPEAQGLRLREAEAMRVLGGRSEDLWEPQPEKTGHLPMVIHPQGDQGGPGTGNDTVPISSHHDLCDAAPGGRGPGDPWAEVALCLSVTTPCTQTSWKSGSEPCQLVAW